MIDHKSGTERQLKTLAKRTVFTLFLTWLALFFTVIGIAAGYKNFLRVHDKAKQATFDAKLAKDLLPELVRKDVVQRWQQDVLKELRQNREQNSQELTELKSVSKTSAHIASTLNQQVRQLTIRQQQVASPQRQTDLWKLEEVRFLLRTAVHKVQLENNPQLASHALRLADQQLLVLGRESLLPVRQAIAKDLALLEPFTVNSDVAVYHHIDDLAARLNTVMQTQSTQEKTGNPNGVETTTEGRNSILGRVRESLSEVVVVRSYDPALAQQISGDAQTVRLQLLRLKLESLKLFALRGDANSFERQLEQITGMLQQQASTLLTRDIQQQLNALKGMQLQPEVPALTSLEVMESQLAKAQGTGTEQ